MNSLSIFILIAMTSFASSNQKIKLHIPSHSPACQHGYRADIDDYFINATVGDNFTFYVDVGWVPELEIQLMQTEAVSFSTICTIQIGRTGEKCGNTSNKTCYCDKFNATTGTAHVVVRTKACVFHSGRSVRGEWRHVYVSSVFSDGDTTLPFTSDVNSVSLTLNVNGDTTNGTSECGAVFKENSVNTVMLCCYKSATPCYPRLTFNEQVVTHSQSPCVRYTFTANETIFNVTKWYSVCSLTDYRPAGFCMIGTSDFSETGRFFNRDPESDAPEKNTYILVLANVVGVVIVCVIFAAVTVYCIEHGDDGTLKEMQSYPVARAGSSRLTVVYE